MLAAHANAHTRRTTPQRTTTINATAVRGGKEPRVVEKPTKPEDRCPSPCGGSGIDIAPVALGTGRNGGEKDDGGDAGEGEKSGGRTCVEEETKATMIRAQMSVLMVGLYEIIRQVGVCWEGRESEWVGGCRALLLAGLVWARVLRTCGCTVGGFLLPCALTVKGSYYCGGSQMRWTIISTCLAYTEPKRNIAVPAERCCSALLLSTPCQAVLTV